MFPGIFSWRTKYDFPTVPFDFSFGGLGLATASLHILWESWMTKCVKFFPSQSVELSDLTTVG